MIPQTLICLGVKIEIKTCEGVWYLIYVLNITIPTFFYYSFISFPKFWLGPQVNENNLALLPLFPQDSTWTSILHVFSKLGSSFKGTRHWLSETKPIKIDAFGDTVQPWSDNWQKSSKHTIILIEVSPWIFVLIQ